MPSIRLETRASKGAKGYSTTCNGSLWLHAVRLYDTKVKLLIIIEYKKPLSHKKDKLPGLASPDKRSN